jgi:hypothetical protein
VAKGSRDWSARDLETIRKLAGEYEDEHLAERFSVSLDSFRTAKAKALGRKKKEKRLEVTRPRSDLGSTAP